MSITFINRGHFFAPHVKPCVLDCSFQVASSDSAGLGILNGSLKGQGIANVFMHTSATPGKGPNGVLNPNPQAGIIYVQLTDNFMKLYGLGHSFQAPLSGSNVAIGASALTVGDIYVITSVGTSTAADYLAVGVPPGITPAVGVAFVAKATGSGSGSGEAQAPAAAGVGVNHIELIGNSALAINPIPVGGSPNVGGYIAIACYADSSSDANVLTAPADGSVISLEFYLSQSSVVVAGE